MTLQAASCTRTLFASSTTSTLQMDYTAATLPPTSVTPARSQQLASRHSSRHRRSRQRDAPHFNRSSASVSVHPVRYRTASHASRCWNRRSTSKSSPTPQSSRWRKAANATATPAKWASTQGRHSQSSRETPATKGAMVHEGLQFVQGGNER